MPRVMIGPHGTVPQTDIGNPMPLSMPEAGKPRGSLEDAIRAKRECVPCQARREPWEDLTWLQRWADAGADPKADFERYIDPKPQPAVPGPPIFGWMHVATVGAWKSIVRELFSQIERSGLRAATSKVFVGVVGPDADLSWFPPWAEVVKRDGPLKLGECSTLQALWDWSKTTPDPGKVWYVHTKGASHPDAANITAWRDYLTYFTVLRWRECAEALDGPYDCCGCDWTVRDNEWFKGLKGPHGPWYHPGHGFEGNLWWSTLDHLRSLPAEEVDLKANRWCAEWAFVGAGNPRVVELHGPHLHLYTTAYPRSRYDGAPIGSSPRPSAAP